jgi:hypothetical protein
MRNMKILKYLFTAVLAFNVFSCSENAMDEVNKDINNSTAMDAKNLLPDAILKTSYETTATDLAWYATVYVEHSAGTWAQSSDADKRAGQTSSSLVNNSWNNIYNVLTICKAIFDKTDPANGTEFDNYWVRGIAQILAAYNLAVATDMWGEIPWTEACLGTDNLKPKYEKQSAIYGYVQALLDDAIVNLNKATVHYADKDYIYGSLTALAANKAAWVKAAYSLKARYLMRLSQRNTNASTAALAAIANGFTAATQGLIFAKYEASNTKSNPWWEFRFVRAHLSASNTLLGLMNDRNDPRRDVYFTKVGGAFVGAPNSTAQEVQTGTYSRSLLTDGNTTARTVPTPLITYHELKFIEAEAKFRSGATTWKTSLQEAIVAAFSFKGLATGATYYTSSVEPLLTEGNELKEIMTQKYIAMYEAEAMEAYNDYRRTGIPTMKNPLNATVGFVNRFPYALSEESSNKENVPVIDIYKDKVWWAGGTEK